jgi:hyaluronoglucosaminidase
VSKPFTTSIIEGFYGRQWTWAQRLSLSALIAKWGYSSYIYAPKGDASLRNNWSQPFETSHRINLEALGASCHGSGLSWGLGLSPVGLQASYGVSEKQLLKNKIQEIKRLKPDILWILFDDLPAGNPQLAQNQIAVVNDVKHQLPEVQLAMCPSYYSFDPILEELFGKCPDHYFNDLSAGLTQDVDILWTGNRVISDSYTGDDCQRAAELLGRKPLIWDNYPVNDGRKTSRFLHLAPFAGRSSEMAQWCRGHAINPMNQFHLSMLVLPTLAAVYTSKAIYNSDLAFKTAMLGLPLQLKALMSRDALLFQEQGLDGIPEEEKVELINDYRKIVHPLAVEVCEWLGEGYRFDPACLTD